MEKASLNFHQIVKLVATVQSEISILTQFKKNETDKDKIKFINDSLKTKKTLKKTLDQMYKEY